MHIFIDTILGKNKNIFLFAIILLVIFFGYQSFNLQLDASSDSLILENDEDLIKSRKVSETYSSNDFLIITLTDDSGIVSQKNIDLIEKLNKDIKSLKWVKSTQSILDAPLLTVNNQTLSDLANEIKTINSKNINLKDAEQELQNSPIFKELIISKDASTSAILINLKENRRFKELLKIRSSTLEFDYDQSINEEYELLKKLNDIHRSQNIIEIRNLIEQYKNFGVKMHLGGIPMIADDTITFVKNDITIFGIGVMLFIIIVLLMIFQSPYWIAAALMNCLVSLILMVGIVSFINWKITVISSNFISLMLILTLSMTVHIIVRYRQLLLENNNLDRISLIKLCCAKMIKPCAFTMLTTIFAFGSLYFSGIKPVMDFGLMMSIGLSVTFITCFTFLPIILSILKLNADNKNVKNDNKNIFLYIASYNSYVIIGLFSLLFIIGIYGSQLLKVENSFVDYFKKDTEIYKGMELIDQKLGGTTPLDVIIQFKANEVIEQDEEDDLFDFDIDYNPEDYWFTEEKINIIKNIHDHLESYPFTGKILSLASLIRTAEKLNDNQEFDALELSVLYKILPKNLKEQIISPYLSIDENQVRISVRIVDTHEELRRNDFIQNLNKHIENHFSSEAYTVSVSGILILYNNMLQSLFDTQINSLMIVMLGIFIMLSILFRSIKIALITIVPNIIACFTILGMMGFLSIPLDLMTITIASITIGIAVDNCIHYVYRYREYYSETNDHFKTIELCQSTVGKAIQNTSFTIIIGFSILIFSNFYPTIYFGIFTALAMLIALLGSLTLLPTLLKYVKV